MSSQLVFGRERPLIMAHRGDPSSAPENTIQSMRKAVEIGVDVLETDVRLTSDNKLVLFHDDDLVRVTGLEGTVRDLTLDELEQVDMGYQFTNDDGKTFPFRGQGYSIVKLSDALEEYPDMRFNLDIKDDVVEAPELLADLITELGRETSVIVGSFHDRQLERFRRLLPQVPTAAHPGEVSRFVFALKAHVASIFIRNPRFQAFQVPKKYGRIQVVEPRFVKAAHDRGIAVHVWTINEREDMEHLIDLGVDGLFTDNPSLMREVLSDRNLL
ncbi:MAG: glycerophosphodiester phosphodiesterase [Candidatus Thorarchaeota archaeon]|jgi:glycerophosphoryl diester phosphodiesterase